MSHNVSMMSFKTRENGEKVFRMTRREMGGWDKKQQRWVKVPTLQFLPMNWTLVTEERKRGNVKNDGKVWSESQNTVKGSYEMLCYKWQEENISY